MRYVYTRKSYRFVTGTLLAGAVFWAFCVWELVH